MTKYYIQKGNQRKGPYDIHELMNQEVFSDTQIWFDGLEDWKPASEITELKPVVREKKSKSVSVNNIDKYKWLIVGGVIAIIVFSILFFNNRNESYSSISPEMEKEIANSSAGNANPADDEVMRRQQQTENIENNKRHIRNNWFNYFKIDRSDFTTEGLGGISGLSVYFENKTGYMLENIYAEIDIYTANGYVYKTEVITFNNVPANSQQTYNVPYSNRGTTVSEPRITYIKSAQLNFCFQPEVNASGDAGDPFRCQ
jgi:hypothetical protein